MFKPIDQNLPSKTSRESLQDLALRQEAQQRKQEEAASYAAILLGCYRKGEAADPEIYTRAIVHVLAQYPEHIQKAVTDPLNGLPSEVGWLPTVKEVRAACESRYGDERRARERRERIRLQLEERERLERLQADRATRPTLAEIRAELAQRGFGQSQKRPLETADMIMQKHGISRAQWDAIPDLPPDLEDTARKNMERR